jgi:glycosyltransferase involved in cell wall biosynthesis
MNHIRNGVDTSLFCKIDNEEKYRKRIKLNLPIYKKIFVSVGLLNRRKNPLRIIDCFNQIHRNDAILVFLGSGELENSCRDFASSSNHIFTRGFSRSVLDYLQASDFFISASLLEGMPNAVMEALATGLPCVLSDIPPHHELWELNPDVVHLFNPNSTSSLVDAVFAILSKNHNTLSNEAVKLAKGSLDATIMVRAYENRYIQRYNETSL